MLEKIPAKLKTSKKLWPHQEKAIGFAIKHLNESDSPCLIRMPTGTGKSGVIAVLTVCCHKGSSLVLTPWSNLRGQLIEDLKNDFWEKVGFAASGKKIKTLMPSTAEDTLESKEASVFVCTFATLNSIRRDKPEIYKLLKQRVSLVFVDEGHYEPAVEWGKSVKGLEAKTVLLTATPYRNDLKLFRITDPERSVHHFTHSDAVKNGVIREVNFQEFKSNISIRSMAEEFAKTWTKIKKSGTTPSKTPRAIICCKDHSDIETVVVKLRELKIDALGIHQRFGKEDGPSLVKSVPNPKTASNEVWVHQNKLTEGLDDNRFCFLALFTDLRNDRKLIQQVGRILRRARGDRKKPATVMSHPSFWAEEQWNAYREFETEFDLLSPQHFRVVVDGLLAAQPKIEYFDGRFRRRFLPDDLKTKPQVIVPPSVLVRRKLPSFSFAQYIEDCTDTLNIEDAVILGPDLNGPCVKEKDHALWVYASVGNSKFLERSSLYEIRLETHCVVESGDFVFLTDSRGWYPREYLDETTLPVGSESLAKFLDDSFRPTAISLNSTVPYDTAVRGSRLHGHNLLGIPASLTDRVHICRGLSGSSSESGRRYVGLSNGRLRQEVSKQVRRHHDLKTFVEWAHGIGGFLDTDIDCNPVFLRFMATCEPPDEISPRTISVDLQKDNIVLRLKNGDECHLEEASVDVHPCAGETDKFTFDFKLLLADGEAESIQIQMEYQAKHQRFWFSKVSGSSSLDVEVSGEDSVSQRTLESFLCFNQALVLVGLEGGEVVYQGRSFYKVDYTHAENALLDLIEQPKVSQCTSEKGSGDQIKQLKKNGSKVFASGSLFKSIHEELELPFEAELLICDDLQTECADFVAANFTEKQLALIHAKGGKGQGISASAFHDVVAQGMKNLAYLTPNSEYPPNIATWHRTAKWNKTKIPVVLRLPKGCATKEKLWDKIKSEIIQSANPDLYVILATTGACNRKKLEDAIASEKKRTPETAQFLHLLDGLCGHARQLGIRTLIYDIPFKKPKPKPKAKS